MKIIFLVALLSIFSYSAIAQTKAPAEWESLTIGGSQEFYMVAYTYRPKSLIKTPTAHKVWIRQKKYRTVDDIFKDVPYALWLIEFKCAEQTLKILKNINYDEKDKVINSMEEPQKDFDDVIPETVGELMLTSMCELMAKKKP